MAEEANFPIELMCRLLQVSRAGFYAWKGRPFSEHWQRDVELGAGIREIHGASRGAYGSPRVHQELQKRGQRTSRKRVARIMRERGLRSRRRKRFRRTTDSQHAQPIAPNVLARRFDQRQTNRVWVADITYLWTREGWLYLAVVLDLASRMVVGWATADRIDRWLCLQALDMALRQRRPGRGLIHHSDRGSQYASDEYQRLLARHGLVPSMSRKGNCWDNAVAESFFGTLKTERLDHEDLETRAQARTALFEFIEGFYNRTRSHSALGYRSPAEFEASTPKIGDDYAAGGA